MFNRQFQCIDVWKDPKTVFPCYTIDNGFDDCYAIGLDINGESGRDSSISDLLYNRIHVVLNQDDFTQDLTLIAESCLSKGLVGMTSHTVYSFEYEVTYDLVLCYDLDMNRYLSALPDGISCESDISGISRGGIHSEYFLDVAFYTRDDMLKLLTGLSKVDRHDYGDEVESRIRRLARTEMDKKASVRKKDLTSFCTSAQYYRNEPEYTYESDTSISLVELRDGHDVCFGACWIRRYINDYQTGTHELQQHWTRCFEPAINLWKAGAMPKPDLFPPLGPLHNPNFTLYEIYLLHQIIVAIPKKYEYPFGWLLSDRAYKMLSRLVTDQAKRDKIEEVFTILKLNLQNH